MVSKSIYGENGTGLWIATGRGMQMFKEYLSGGPRRGYQATDLGTRFRNHGNYSWTAGYVSILYAFFQCLNPCISSLNYLLL